ncbi:MAG TPA: hypothetical protein IAA26_05150 [Candidatus Blautia faecipullorum]|nr:hypothetical protein [Candidatus Blautia faecipullorum]
MKEEKGMQQVDIFLIISSRSPGKMRRAWYKYIMVCGKHRIEEKEDVQDISGHRLLLICAVAAMKRMRLPSLITIHTDSHYLADNRLSDWEKAGWKRADGKNLRNADLWQRLSGLLSSHAVRFRVEDMSLYKYEK